MFYRLRDNLMKGREGHETEGSEKKRNGHNWCRAVEEVKKKNNNEDATETQMRIWKAWEPINE